MSAQHTPGPWQHAHDGHYGLWSVSSIGPTGDARDVARLCTLEDARLMAVAPELLEALEGDVLFFDSIANHEHWEATGIGNLCQGYAARRRDLIAKATGAA